MADEKIHVEVAYARSDEQVILPLEVEAGTTVGDALRRSGILERFPEIDPDAAKLGVFGKLTPAKATLSDGDRVEIYRPLIADPKETRKKRAAEGKVMRKGAREAGKEGED